jgi:hypothetical protein
MQSVPEPTELPHLGILNALALTKAGRLNCCWSSPADSSLFPGVIETYDQDFCLARAVVQEVSHWLPTAEARVRVRACGVCGGQSGTGVGFLRVF